METLTTLSHVSLEMARSHLFRHILPPDLPSELCPVAQALNRILSEDIAAERNIPHYRASAVDGYALSAQETAGASPARPVRLQPRNYSWVNTGNVVDDCFDAVVMVEDTSLNGDTLAIAQPLTAGTNVRPPGDDVMRGQVIGRRRDRVTPQLQALLIAAGIKELRLFHRLKAVYFPTGNEIVPADDGGPLCPGTVPETNSTLLKGIFARWDYSLDVGPIVPDDPLELSKALKTALESYDLVLIGAGSAKGKRDYSADVLATMGEVLFRWIRTRPGRPAMAAKIDNKPVICLPGFPMSSAVTAFGIVYPLLKHLEGSALPNDWYRDAIGSLAEEKAHLLFSHSSSAGVEEWLRCQIGLINGRRLVWPIAGGASSMWAMSEADGLVIISEEKLECPKGMEVNFHRLRSVDLERRILFQGSNDPALERIVTHLRRRGGDMILRSVGSLAGLAALSRQEAHIAACHLLDPVKENYNDSYIEQFQGDARWKRQILFFRQQGILVKRGNPKKINCVEDFARPDVSIVNRQPGAGTRVLLDHLLKKAGIPPHAVRGYGKQCLTHLDAASRVAFGLGDAAIAIRPAAEAMELEFIPITEEPYEIIYPECYKGHPGLVALIEATLDPLWKHDVEKLGGYRWNN